MATKLKLGTSFFIHCELLALHFPSSLPLRKVEIKLSLKGSTHYTEISNVGFLLYLLAHTPYEVAHDKKLV